jgi:hypothetical protein
MRAAQNGFFLLLLAIKGIGAPPSYVGSEVCAGCHRQIYSTYLKTEMGRSMSADLKGTLIGQVTIRNQKIDRYFDIRMHGDGLYQAEYELAENGSEIFRNEQRIAYSIGAGQNGVSYLVERNGFLFQAPLSFYSLVKKWGMSPGFEALDLGFNRPVLPACLDCHSGVSPPRSHGLGEYVSSSFKQLAIGCENCHGPGSIHVAERGRGLPVRNLADQSIVNPAKLSPWLADNICMACHQGRTLRVLQPGKQFYDFRPGTPLNNTMAIFAAPLPEGNSPVSLSPLLEHYTLMSLSRCYTATQGRLGCVTCHDPHVQSTDEPATYFRQKCLSCHQESSCSLPIETRKMESRSDNCVECHMPKLPVSGIAHTVLTNHRIVRSENEAFPSALFNSSKPVSYDLIHLNAEIDKPDQVPALTAFRAYTELAAANPAYLPQYKNLLKIVSKQDAEEPDVLSAMGWLKIALGPEHDTTQAMNFLTRAIDRGSLRLEDYQALADLLSKNGQASEAEIVLEKGIRIAPFDERMYKQLSFIYMSTHRYAEALTIMRKTVRMFPEDSFMRSLLQKVDPPNGQR